MEFQKLEFKNRPEEEMVQRSKHFLEMIKFGLMDYRKLNLYQY